MNDVLQSLILASLVFSQLQTSWPIGLEREVDAGTYMQVVASQYGWRIWKIDTRGGSQCKAVKSAIGRPHPIPLGVSSTMMRGTPFVEITWNAQDHGFSYRWTTTHYGRVEIKYRSLGERFWEERENHNFSGDSLNESRYEIQLSSWEYPAILIGYAEESATFDFEGLAWAKSQVASCENVVPDARSIVWLSRPTPSFPESALSQGFNSGRVELDCEVDLDGRLTQCQVVSETPADVGFARAAIESLRTARVSVRGPRSEGDIRHRFTSTFRLQ